MKLSPAADLYLTTGTSPSEATARLTEAFATTVARETYPAGSPRRPTGRSHPIRISFVIESDHAPALRSAVEEISSLVGGRLAAYHQHLKEAALTDAAVALGALRAAVNATTPAGAEFYA